MPAEEHVAPWAETLARVRDGNEKIWDVFRAALDLDIETQRDRWDREMDRVEKAVERLSWLCQEIEALGYTGCLYDKPTCSLQEEWAWCWACPSKTPHWRGAAPAAVTPETSSVTTPSLF
jgi:hypothetical protein